ncbi:hypothetical protein Clacol_010603 [Clathrus columnatus]|uniref:Uncharacterized protein n=1 Tax=Clathrus columnatus TaxID=1419009 RepID=A0AAV5APZ7_9AGAM|nr:hypothetical protein Clacol_009026 [Clathrus columnatus]GJJ16306.1 hypothetical protein Clacol_010603 [Clathrus columnatus]
MFTHKVILPLILALANPTKADLQSACGFFATIGAGFDTSSSDFSLLAFPALTSPEDTSTGIPLGVVSGVLTVGLVCNAVNSPASFALQDGALVVPASALTAPLLKNHSEVILTPSSTPASQFCLTVSTSPAGGSPYPLLAVNATVDGNFAICSNKVVFRPSKHAECKAVDLRMV